MLYRIYKTLFFAMLACLIWVGTVILSFFGGMIAMSIWQDKKNEDEESTEDSMHLTRPYNEETSTNWSPESEINLLFLRNTENYINDLLKMRGHVFLNDVYDQLGMKRTSHGAVAGWLFRDNVLIAFMPNDLKPGEDIVLEFDYDGIIYDRLVVLD